MIYQLKTVIRKGDKIRTNKIDRQKRASLKQTLSKDLTVNQRIEKLNKRLGKGQGATKERTRLEKKNNNKEKKRRSKRTKQGNITCHQL